MVPFGPPVRWGRAAWESRRRVREGGWVRGTAGRVRFAERVGLVRLVVVGMAVLVSVFGVLTGLFEA
jgi:hypothetical protein